MGVVRLVAAFGKGRLWSLSLSAENAAAIGPPA